MSGATAHALRGAKKGGARTPQEQPDSLRSTQVARVLEFVSEGEIEGLAMGAQSVLLDGVPLENADGSRNFANVSVGFVPGTQGQAALPGTNEVENTVPVAVEVKQATPVIRSITTPTVDSARVSIYVPQLSFQNMKNGDLGGAAFAWAVDVQSAGGGWVQVLVDTVDGKTTSGYRRSKQFSLAAVGPAPWDVRVRRISPDSTQSNRIDAFMWESLTEVQTLKLRHPNRAAVALQVDAQQFGRIPTRAYDILGIRCQVPTNYDPIARTYTGLWDGTFKTAWTDNPAWVYYHLVTHERTGLGLWIDPASVNKWQLYRIGQYCDELVPDGYGGQEPRFTCNVVISSPASAYRVLQDIAAVFRGMAYWSASTVQITQDAPADPVALFTPANVEGGVFQYADTSEAELATVAIVWWNDAAQLGKRTPEVVVRRDLVKRFGLRRMEMSPLATWSRGQAHRLGLWALYSQEAENDTVQFRVGLEGLAVMPGQVFKVADPGVAGERLGGRLAAGSTATALNLDANVTLQAGQTYMLSLVWPDDTVPLGYRTEARTVSTAAGTTAALAVATAFGATPQPGQVWLLESGAVQATLWRCTRAAEVAGTNIVEVSGVAHHPGKYAAIEAGVALEQRNVSRLSDKAASPASVAAVETFYATASGMRQSRLSVSFAEPAPLQRYRITWRRDNGPWQALPEQAGTSFDIDNLQPCAIDIEVRGVNAIGNVSHPPATRSINILGKTAKPPAFEFFNVLPQADGTREYTFGYTVTARPIDLAGAEIRWALGTITVDEAAWAGMTPLLRADGAYPTSPFENNQLAAGVYTIAARALDDSGNLSDGISTIYTTLPDPRLASVIQDEYPHRMGWPGTKTNCVLIDGVLEAESTTTWDDLGSTTWDDMPMWAVGAAPTLSYEHTVIDLGTSTSARALVTLRGTGTFTIEEQTSTDGTTWTAWAPAGTTSVWRYVRLRFSATATPEEPLATLVEAVIYIDGKLVSDYINDLDIAALAGAYRIGAGDVRIPLTKPIKVIKHISVTFQGVVGVWGAVQVDRDTTTGPRYQFRNPAGALADPPPIDCKIDGLI